MPPIRRNMSTLSRGGSVGSGQDDPAPVSAPEQATATDRETARAPAPAQTPLKIQTTVKGYQFHKDSSPKKKAVL